MRLPRFLQHLFTKKAPTMSDIMTKTLGYVNAKPCQLSLPPPDAQSSPMYLTENQPVVTPEGYLTGYQAKLEKYVSNGMLRRILKDDPKFCNWDKVLDIRRNRTVHPVKPLEREVVGGKLPTATISSRTGITYEDREPTRVVQKNQPPPPGNQKEAAFKKAVNEAADLIVAAKEAAAEATPAKRGRGRPPTKAAAAAKPAARAVVPPQQSSGILEKDGLFYVGDREFESRVAAETAIKVSQQLG